MIYTPNQAQIEMIQRGVTVPRVALWAQMGLGKTSATLSIIRDLEIVQPMYPALVVAPIRVALNTWPKEVLKWDHLSGLRVSPIVGTAEQRLAAMKRDAEIYTINYENLPWLREALGHRWPFRTIVADESTKLKNFRYSQGGIRSKALGQVAHNMASTFIELTGTPSPNGLKDLWGQLWYLDRGKRLFKTYRKFMKRWFIEDRETKLVMPQSYAFDQITERCKDICFSFKSSDYMNVDEPAVFDVEVELPKKHRAAYDRLEDEFFLAIEKDVRVVAVNTGARSQKLMQYVQGAVYTEDAHGKKHSDFKEIHDIKLQALASIREEAAGMPLLVAYFYKPDKARIMREFPDAVDFAADPTAEDRFNAGEIPMLLIHYQSDAHGVNLQYGTNVVVLFTMTWNLEWYEQIIERVGPVRQKQSGLDRGTNVYRIVMRGTIDKLIANRLSSKADLQSSLIKASKNRRSKSAAY